MSYQPSPRKFRPQTFSSVVGQEAIVTTLKNALRHNRLAYAYLFCGSRGTGKTTLARLLAKAINCHHLTEEMEPCNACPSCLDMMAGKSLDILEIDGASNRGIDDMRTLNETVGYAPASCRYKIYIIDEVHMLTKEAFNALLKTLEEPPSHVKFFFATTEPHKVLPTIVSRCQRFDLNRITQELMIHKLKRITDEMNIACDEQVFSLISQLSEGSLRDGESLLDQIICSTEAPITTTQVSRVLGLVPHQVLFALDKAFEKHSLSYAFELTEELFTSGKDIAYFLDTLLEHYRTLLQLKLGKQPSLIHEREHYIASAALYSEEQCLYILDYLIEWQQQLNRIPFKRILLEMILLHLIRSKYRLSPATLVKRLMDLEQRAPSSLLHKEEVASVAQVPERAPITEARTSTITKEEKQELPAKEPVTIQQPTRPNPARYDTLLRFAAVELEGTTKKEG